MAWPKGRRHTPEEIARRNKTRYGFHRLGAAERVELAVLGGRATAVSPIAYRWTSVTSRAALAAREAKRWRGGSA